jgi:hypothetical protein
LLIPFPAQFPCLIQALPPDFPPQVVVMAFLDHSGEIQKVFAARGIAFLITGGIVLFSVLVGFLFWLPERNWMLTACSISWGSYSSSAYLSFSNRERTLIREKIKMPLTPAESSGSGLLSWRAVPSPPGVRESAQAIRSLVAPGTVLLWGPGPR